MSSFASAPARGVPTLRRAFPLAAAVAIVAACLVLDNPEQQRPTLLVPFLSGAANFEIGEGWRYSEQDVERFRALPDLEARARHRFAPSPESELRSYELSDVGLVYVLWAGRGVLPWLGDLQVLEWLQIALHVVLTLFVASRLRSLLLRAAFVVLYGLNPLVLWVVTLPYYYVWPAISGALVAAYLLDPTLRLRGWALPAAAVLALVHAIRPTAILVSCLLFVLVARRESLALGAASLALLAVLAFGVFGGVDRGKDPWHTAYIALGAHPNPYVARFEDQAAYDEFRRRTGETVDAGPGGNYFDPEFRRRLSRVTREAYLEIARKDPLLIVRNAALHYFQSLSIGYFTDSLALHLASAAAGVLVFAALLWKRHYGFLVALTLAGLPFVPYTAPTPLYMFGSYVLLVAAAMAFLRDVLPDAGRLGAWLPERREAA